MEDHLNSACIRVSFYFCVEWRPLIKTLNVAISWKENVLAVQNIIFASACICQHTPRRDRWSFGLGGSSAAIGAGQHCSRGPWNQSPRLIGQEDKAVSVTRPERSATMLDRVVWAEVRITSHKLLVDFILGDSDCANGMPELCRVIDVHQMYELMADNEGEDHLPDLPRKLQ